VGNARICVWIAIGVLIVFVSGETVSMDAHRVPHGPAPTSLADAERDWPLPRTQRAGTSPQRHLRPPLVRDLSTASWTRHLDHAIVGQPVSVSVGVGRRLRFSSGGRIARLPASNEKLLSTMAALDRFGSSHRFTTSAAGNGASRRGVLRGDLWLVGSGDPELTGARLARLASRLRAAGLRRVEGDVIGDRCAFDRGWWAPGWIPGLSRSYVNRPTALGFDANRSAFPPEHLAAQVLSTALARTGIRVQGDARMGCLGEGSQPLAAVRSAPLRSILRRQNHGSINFDAEMITKALGARGSRRGSTASGARAIEAWAAGLGVEVDAYDGSGLSHRDHVTTTGLVTLLLTAMRRRWGIALLRSLPGGGEGTLAGRLAGIPVNAKTGTLFVTPVSALSGYVRDAEGRLVAFSILSRGLDKSTAVAIEDRVVAILAAARVG
jgi:D-alanyl-D-alanine carboxypeptidase/D-alanyl-D-alanine-endopeptidase (penicillin-binding protein 4)